MADNRDGSSLSVRPALRYIWPGFKLHGTLCALYPGLVSHKTGCPSDVRQCPNTPWGVHFCQNYGNIERHEWLLTFHITGRFILICIYMLNDGNPREGWFLKNDRGSIGDHAEGKIIFNRGSQQDMQHFKKSASFL